MTKVHTGLLNMDKSTFGVSRKGVSFRTTQHNVNRRVQTNDLIISGLGEREEKRKKFLFSYKKRFLYTEKRVGSSFFELVCFVFSINGQRQRLPTNQGRREKIVAYNK